MSVYLTISIGESPKTARPVLASGDPRLVRAAIRSILDFLTPTSDEIGVREEAFMAGDEERGGKSVRAGERDKAYAGSDLGRCVTEEDIRRIVLEELEVRRAPLNGSLELNFSDNCDHDWWQLRSGYLYCEKCSQRRVLMYLWL